MNRRYCTTALTAYALCQSAQPRGENTGEGPPSTSSGGGGCFCFLLLGFFLGGGCAGGSLTAVSRGICEATTAVIDTAGGLLRFGATAGLAPAVAGT